MERDVFNSDPNTRRKTKRIKEAKRKESLRRFYHKDYLSGIRQDTKEESDRKNQLQQDRYTGSNRYKRMDKSNKKRNKNGKVTLKDKLIKHLKTKGFQDDLWMKKHLDKQSLDKQRLKLKRD